MRRERYARRNDQGGGQEIYREAARRSKGRQSIEYCDSKGQGKAKYGWLVGALDEERWEPAVRRLRGG
jgi:hypothetical protein